MLRKRKLGRSGFEVSELALGGLLFGSFGTDAGSAEKLIQRALELGTNYIDTASDYLGRESVPGDALRKMLEELKAVVGLVVFRPMQEPLGLPLEG